VITASLQALAGPRSPAVLVPGGRSLRIEINLAAQVLVLYRGNQVSLISHVSTGGGYYYCSPGGGCGYAATPAGDYRTTTFMPGWVTVPLGEMYNPVFFIGTEYAIHGATDVPLGPTSHGCVRISMNTAGFFHTLVPTPGTLVYIRR
jgi:lipoprotein-anchoring transpeptidase ErfK/SrfK